MLVCYIATNYRVDAFELYGEDWNKQVKTKQKGKQI